MSFIMSVILYNPLEIYFLWCMNRIFNNLRDNNINKFKFIYKLYLCSFIVLIFQYLTQFLNQTPFYIFSTILANYIILPLISGLFIKPKNFMFHYLLTVLYLISLIALIVWFNMPFMSNKLSSVKFLELYANLSFKFIQFLVLFLIKGVIIIMKKILKQIAKQNIKESIAPTAFGYGEPKISKKMKQEIKDAD